MPGGRSQVRCYPVANLIKIYIAITTRLRLSLRHPLYIPVIPPSMQCTHEKSQAQTLKLDIIAPCHLPSKFHLPLHTMARVCVKI